MPDGRKGGGIRNEYRSFNPSFFSLLKFIVRHRHSPLYPSNWKPIDSIEVHHAAIWCIATTVYVVFPGLKLKTVNPCNADKSVTLIHFITKLFPCPLPEIVTPFLAYRQTLSHTGAGSDESLTEWKWMKINRSFVQKEEKRSIWRVIDDSSFMEINIFREWKTAEITL